MTWYMPIKTVWGFANRHEGNDRSRDHYADMHNNQAGINIGVAARSKWNLKDAVNFIVNQSIAAYRRGALG